MFSTFLIRLFILFIIKICIEIFTHLKDTRKPNKDDSDDINNIVGFFGIALLLISLFYLLSLLIKKFIEKSKISMSRLNKNIKFNLKKNVKIEINFVYTVKNGRLQSFNLCYRIEKVEIAGKTVEEKEIPAEALAVLFQKNILERFLLRLQTKNTFYSVINLILKNEMIEQNYKHYLIPKLYGTATENVNNIRGVYSCKCIDETGKKIVYKLYDISIAPAENRADIFMNNLIPPANTTFKINGEEKGVQYNLELVFCGKKLSSTVQGTPELIEIIEIEFDET